MLTSGLHGSAYVQCAKVLQYPKYNEILCKELASRFEKDNYNADVVLGAAVGGILVSYELARQFDARAIFAERVDGELKLRRGMEIFEGENVLIVEDVITTGGTTKELIELTKMYNCSIIGIAALVNRNPEKAKFDFKTEVLLSEVMEDYDPQNCPLCNKGIPLIKPGSRKIK